jgi:hypothetical protein
MDPVETKMASFANFCARIIKGSTILFAYNTCYAVKKYLGFKREFKVITSPEIIINQSPSEVLIDGKYFILKYKLKFSYRTIF